MRCFTSLVLAGAFGTLAATAAQAADMAFPPMEEPPPLSQPVELGTGWYLRGDVGWSRDQGPLIAPSGNPPGSGLPTIDLLSSSAITNSYSLDLGIGYKFNNWLRADLVYDYRKPQSANAAAANVWCPYNLMGLTTQGTNPVELGYYANPSDTCTPQQSATLSRQDLLLNGYVDIGTWLGVTPYVGAGAGFVRTQATGSVDYFETANDTLYNANLTPTGTYPPVWTDVNGNPIAGRPGCPSCTPVSFTQQNWNRSIKSTSYNFAWALMGGFAVDITDHLQLDIGYRYVNLGTFSVVDPSTGQTVREKQSTQEIRAGFRYMVD